MTTNITTRSKEESSLLRILETSPKSYLQALRVKSVDEVFDSPHPSLVRVQNEFGENHARAVVVLLLGEVLDFFNVTEPMNDAQMAETTDLIIEEYPHFKIDDLKLCFKNAKKGKYGKVYNRIDGQIILGWLKQYNIERCSRADDISYNEHKALDQEQQNDGCFYEDYRKNLQERASSGDKDAQKALQESESFMEMVKRRKLERQRKDLDEFYANEALRNKVDEQE